MDFVKRVWTRERDLSQIGFPRNMCLNGTRTAPKKFGLFIIKIERDQITNMQAPRTHGLGELYPHYKFGQESRKPAPRIQNMLGGTWPVPIK